MRKMIILLFSVIFFCASEALPEGVSASEKISREGDYDLMSLNGIQLMKNPSFEERRADKWQAEYWGWNPDERAQIYLVEDIMKAKHGTTYLHVDGREKGRQFGGHIKGFPTGELRCELWMRGKGTVSVWITVPAKNARGKNVYVSKHIELSVDTKDWKLFIGGFVLPNLSMSANKMLVPKKMLLQFCVNGEIDIDRVLVYQPNAKSKQLLFDSKETQLNMPFVEIPRLESGPLIDGEISNDPAWQHAAAITGFAEILTDKPSSLQPVVNIAYDDKNLYAAFTIPASGRFSAGRDAASVDFSSDAVEIWLSPSAGNIIQIFACPSGAYFARKIPGANDKGIQIDYKSKVNVIYETVAGIETFDKRNWTAEFAIPFSKLGLKTPEAGDLWRANFCRDYNAEIRERFTSWASITGGFNDRKEFGTIRFGKKVCAIKVLSIGRFVEGQLSVSGKATSGKKAIRLIARTELENGQTVSFNSQDIIPDATTDKPFMINNELRSNSAIEAVFSFRAEALSDGRLLSMFRRKFKTQPSLQVRAIPIYQKNKLYLETDMSKISGLSGEATLNAYVDSGDKHIKLASCIWKGGTNQVLLEANLETIPSGHNTIVIEITPVGSKAPIASTVLDFNRIAKPAWMGNNIGIMTTVPAPWSDVKTKGNQAVITERTYIISSLGLPEQITAKGEKLLIDSAKLVAIVGGKDLAWQCKPLSIIEQTPRKVVYSIEGQAGPIRISGTAALEFDGFVLWRVKIQSDSPVTLDALRLEFPFCKDRSLYARGKRRAYDDEVTVTAGLWLPGNPQPISVANFPYSPTGWAWPDKWLAEIWIGDDSRGLSIMNQSQLNIIGPKRVTIDRETNKNRLSIHLISQPFTMTHPLDYEFFWQATPVKPQPSNSKIWHMADCAGSPLSIINPFFNNVYGVLFWDGVRPSYSEYCNESNSKHLLALYGQYGIKLLPYFCVSAGWTDSPEFKIFGSEWERIPTGGFGGSQGKFTITSLNSSYKDFLLYQVERIIDNLGFKGLYLDVSGVISSQNPYQEPCFRDPNTGKIIETLDMLAARDFYMRAYQFMNSGGRDAMLFRHGMPVTSIAGFVNCVTQGEEWGGEQSRQYSKLTPDMFRIREMYIQYGTPFLWYCFHGYHMGDNSGGIVPLHTILTYTLPHHVLPYLGHGDIYRVWKVLDPFWTESEWIPYWSPKSPVIIKEPGILGTVYAKVKQGEALLIVANWNDKKFDSVDVKIDLKAIGIDPEKVEVTRAVEHPIVNHIHRMRNQVPTYKTRDIRYSNGIINVQLHPKNLEIIRLKNK